MATLTPRSFSSIVSMIAAGVQGRAGKVLDYSVGSTLRAIAEAHAGVALWLQALILKLLLTTRASTSTGADLDSFYADFGLARLPPSPASGVVQFTRLTASATTPFIAVGSTVRSFDGSQTYEVVANVGHPFYSAAQGGYVMPAMVSYIDIPVRALTTGAAANALAGSITQITSPIIGIDAVINPANITNGSDGESDEAFRQRFVFFIGSLSKSTVAAIQYAITSLQPGMVVTVLEHKSPDLTDRTGYLTITIDDGSGAPSASLIDKAATAVAGVRAAGIEWGVFAPLPVQVSIVLTFDANDGYDRNTSIALITAAVKAYVGSLSLGQSLYSSKVIQVALSSSAGVKNISSLTVNGLPSNLIITARQRIILSAISVS